MIFVAVAAAVGLLLLLLYRIYDVLRKRPLSVLLDGKDSKVKTLAVLGSGGHTTEMLRLLSTLDRNKYSPISFVIAATDNLGAGKAKKFDSNSSLFIIPRSREVGQSWSSSVFSTLKSIAYSFHPVISAKPDLILCNGPGTCVPICLIVFLFRIIGFLPNSRIVYIESIARVQSLSLSGKILYHFADAFIVQWPELKQKYPNSQYLVIS